MRKDLTDKELDRLMNSIVGDAAREDELHEIAGSPTVWWAVQREIAKGESAKQPWPPKPKVLRLWLMILAPTAVAAALLIALFVFWPQTTQNDGPAVAEGPTISANAEPKRSIAQPILAPTTEQAKTSTATTSRGITRPAKIGTQPPQKAQLAKNVSKPVEVKTEFIALTYARNPESGQIVRVKVPRSMMAQLGLVASVTKPNDLVDAEVVVGDDGLTRAIRFIH